MKVQLCICINQGVGVGPKLKNSYAVNGTNVPVQFYHVGRCLLLEVIQSKYTLVL